MKIMVKGSEGLGRLPIKEASEKGFAVEMIDDNIILWVPVSGDLQDWRGLRMSVEMAVTMAERILEESAGAIENMPDDDEDPEGLVNCVSPKGRPS